MFIWVLDEMGDACRMKISFQALSIVINNCYGYNEKGTISFLRLSSSFSNKTVEWNLH